ncbi:PQQ-binding-like beta-propeller repeat protein [Streptomyces caatingaensis]|uniref:Pyrrolo-quinoline quinone repeat domain-containing protein n=1 Tax=Streptomyces caatingaensis TaxID=1678637 RepID=A0A0K9XIC4_9ACTN|nr:PQQ-binding-like beta-propeller repeat protein [Streptomyces caatingaensis]KNB52786.1 hypothetical protein AC230_09060 [Streptomyces caatingaensis]
MNATAGASPYSTGGGGTVFEHHFGAVLLSYLLTRTPVPGLGDHVTPVEIRFQARAVAAVDDYLVTGLTDKGTTHRMSIAVRRRPKLTPGDPLSVELMKSFLLTLRQRWTLMTAGRWQLALAVAAPYPRAASLQALTTAAVAAGSAGVFHRRVAEPGRLNKSDRSALANLKGLVAAAVSAGAPDAGCTSDTLTWRLLAHLSVLDLRLEGVRPPDRTAAVERLLPVTARTEAADGDALFSRLREFASDCAPAGATVTRESLLRALRGLSFIPDEGTAPLPKPPRPRRGRAAVRGLPRPLWSCSNRLRPGACQPHLHGDALLVVDGYVLHAFDAVSGEPLWGPKPMGHNNQPPVDGTTVFLSGMGNTLRPRDIRSGAETGPRVDHCAAAQAVCDRGTLYVPDLQGALHAYDADSGRLLWGWRPEPTPPGFLEAPRVVDNSVFVTWTSPGSSRPWTLQALHAESGQPRWPEPLRLLPPERWLISDDTLLAISSEVGAGAPRLAAYDAQSGSLLWQKQLSNGVVGKPTACEKSFLLAHPDGHVSSWNALTGEHRWTTKVARSLRTQPVAMGGHVLITSWDPGRLIALNSAEGTVTWQSTPRRAAALMTPAYLAGSSAWAVSRAGVLQGWDLDTRRRLPGEREDLLWKPAEQGIPRAWDGVLYLVTGNGSLQAIRLDRPV